MAGTIEAKRKGTVKTEAIIGSGLKAMDMLLKNATTAITRMEALKGEAESLSIKIADGELRLQELQTKHNETKRQLEVQLEIDMREATNTVVTEFLNKQGKIAVTGEGYTALQQELAALKANTQKQIDAQVAIVSNTMKSRYESDTKLAEAQFQTKEAANTAAIKGLEEKVKFLETQATLWKTALDDERKASVERAKASSVGSINVQGPSR